MDDYVLWYCGVSNVRQGYRLQGELDIGPENRIRSEKGTWLAVACDEGWKLFKDHDGQARKEQKGTSAQTSR